MKKVHSSNGTRAVIYARVSSKEQEREGFSIPAQLKLLREYATRYGFEITNEYTDVETAKRTGRANFGKMLDYLRHNGAPCRAILVEKTDRLYRNIKDWVTLDEIDVEIHFVKENFILSKNSRSTEKFLHGIKVLMAKNYIDNLSEEVKKGHMEKAEQGEWPSIAPVGYRNDKETHRIEIDPEKGPFIRKLFEWYATGNYSLERLASIARESGLFSRNSKPVNKAGIHRILNNPIYYGEFVWKGKRYPGTHQPLITKGLFDQVQDVFRRANHPQETKRKLPFAGLLKCGKCGCALTPEIKKGKYVYYHCTQHRGKCDNTYVREEKLAELLADVVKRIRIDEKTAEAIRTALLESEQDKVQFHTEAVKSLQKRYTHLQSLLDRAYEDKLAGKITEEFWERKSREWNAELLDIEHQIKAHRNANLNYYETGAQILELANRAYDLYLQQDRREQRRLLNTILSNCAFYRGTLCPTYRKPFDILAKGAELQSIRGRRDSNSRPPA